MVRKPAVNTREAVASIARRMGCYAKDARELLLEHFPAVLVEAVSQGKKVHLAGLGTFYPRRGRKGLRVAFRPARGLIRAVREKNGESES
ncbi:HU family DNA-binding protein [Desulfofundulus thermocisternus]|uniref:HU family DNA-binding protein n=1 Tax=Desulfofundulus thermocisternus TaxID=42471 RepID=UPI000486FFE6|nr:HU family DNA-binding protein [Desulfofundulus thermocisternus]